MFDLTDAAPKDKERKQLNYLSLGLDKQLICFCFVYMAALSRITK